MASGVRVGRGPPASERAGGAFVVSSGGVGNERRHVATIFPQSMRMTTTNTTCRRVRIRMRMLPNYDGGPPCMMPLTSRVTVNGFGFGAPACCIAAIRMLYVPRTSNEETVSRQSPYSTADTKRPNSGRPPRRVICTVVLRNSPAGSSRSETVVSTSSPLLRARFCNRSWSCEAAKAGVPPGIRCCRTSCIRWRSCVTCCSICGPRSR